MHKKGIRMSFKLLGCSGTMLLGTAVGAGILFAAVKLLA